MELPSRPAGDRLLRAGEMTDIRRRLRRLARRHDLRTVVVCAFDHRTRMLPFLYADRWMAPVGPRAVGAAMVDAGFAKTRIVLQQWNRNVRPSRMRLAGRTLGRAEQAAARGKGEGRYEDGRPPRPTVALH